MLTGQALLDDMNRRADEENERNRFDAVFLVEATHNEWHHLWVDWSEESLAHGWGDHQIRRLQWEQISLGYRKTIGHFGGMPVAVSVSFARLRGLVVASYEATSQVVDYRMVEKWRKKEFPSARGHTNASNFHICAHALDDARMSDRKTQ